MRDENEIRFIVKTTLQELIRMGLIDFRRKQAYAEIKQRLMQYYLIGDDPELEEVLGEISSDEYFPIISFCFEDLYTTEQIASFLGRDASTIARNKRRLLLELHKRLDNERNE